MQHARTLKIALLAGGSSAERAISLASGKYVAAALQALQQPFTCFDPKTDLAKLAAKASQFDLAWPALHGTGGEDGGIQAFLNLIGLPFVGSGLLAMAQTFNKAVIKQIYQSHRIPVAPGLRIPRNSLYCQKEIIQQLGFPCFVKPVESGSSFGAGIVRQQSELRPALKKTWRFGDALVEKLLAGVELTVGVLESTQGLQALPVVEIRPQTEFFDLKAKYNPTLCAEICPAEIPPQLAQRVQNFALKIHTKFNLRHFSRTDFIVVRGKIYTLETNTLPGLTQDSLLPKAIRAAGFTFNNFVAEILQVAHREKNGKIS